MPGSSRERSFVTEAVILRVRDYGEADRILDTYSVDYGRLDVIAKGARKTHSRSGAYLDVCSWLELDLARGRDLDVLRGARLVHSLPRLRSDLDCFSQAHYLVELVRILNEPEEPNSAVFDLLTQSLVLLNDGVGDWAVTRYFELALLSHLGYHPEFFTCVHCGQPIAPTANAFSAALGGFLCPNCRSADPTAIPLSLNAQKFLRLVQRDGLSAALRVTPTPAEKQEIQAALGHYVRYIAERDTNSLRVMQQLQSPIERDSHVVDE